MSIERIKPASQADVVIYVPYFQGTKRNLLPLAIGLYQRGSFEGHRNIEGGDRIPFVATWYISTLPAELTRCRLQFDGNAELSYEVMMQNAEFMDFLIDVIQKFKRTRTIDFSRPFYRRLLRMDE